MFSCLDVSKLRPNGFSTTIRLFAVIISFSCKRSAKLPNNKGETENQFNPNGSLKNIAGIFNKEKNVLGMMPHPERMIDESLSGEDGSLFFKNLINNIK